MSGVPRSQVLVKYLSVAGGKDQTFVVPDNCVVLLKAAAFQNQGSTAANIALRLWDKTAGMLVELFTKSLAAGETYEWAGWEVLNPADVVWPVTTAPSVAVWISGAVLLGPPPFPPNTAPAP